MAPKLRLAVQGAEDAPRIASSPIKEAAGLAACAVVIEFGLVVVLLLGRPASFVPEFTFHYLLASIGWVVACWIVVNWRGRPFNRALTGGIWAAALLFRLTVLPLDPSLSEDTARYRWQGVMQDAGGDPYVTLPQDQQWIGLRDATWPRVTGKDKASIYGPILEQCNLWVFRATQAVTSDPWRQVWLFKLFFAIAEIGLGLSVMGLLAAAGRPRSWALIYLWSPLPVVEFWIEGHHDAIASALVIGALALAVRGNRDWAVPVCVAAVFCKLWPVVVLPFLVLERRDNGSWNLTWRGLLASIPLAAALSVPYWHTLWSAQSVVDGFAGGWRNNDSLFALLLNWTGDDVDLAARLAGAILLAWIVGSLLTRRPVTHLAVGTVSAALLLAPNCFPWYLAWMLPLLALHPIRPLMLWSVLAVLAYHVVPAYEAVGVWRYDPFVVRMEYAPVLLWLAWIGGSQLRSAGWLHALRSTGVGKRT